MSSKIPYLEQLTDGETLTPAKAAVLALQLKSVSTEAETLSQQVADLAQQVAGITPYTPPYKTYVALLTQEGTNDPSVFVLEDTLGESITWTRTAENLYTGACSSPVFHQSKTIWNSAVQTCIANNSSFNTYQYLRSDDYSFVAYGKSSSSDGQLANALIEIKVYQI